MQLQLHPIEIFIPPFEVHRLTPLCSLPIGQQFTCHPPDLFKLKPTQIQLSINYDDTQEITARITILWTYLSRLFCCSSKHEAFATSKIFEVSSRPHSVWYHVIPSNNSPAKHSCCQRNPPQQLLWLVSFVSLTTGLQISLGIYGQPLWLDGELMSKVVHAFSFRIALEKFSS